MKAALAARAAQTGQSEAELIRAALDAALAAPVATAPPVGPADPPLPGRLVGVGVGPGEADLLTLRAVAALRRADRVVAPTTAVDAVGRAEAIVRQALPGVVVERIAFAMSPARSARDRSVGPGRHPGRPLPGRRRGGGVDHAGRPAHLLDLLGGCARRTRAAPRDAWSPRSPASWLSRPWPPGPGRSSPTSATRLTIRTALDGDDLGPDLRDPATTVVVYKGGRRLPEIAAEAGRLRRGPRSGRWPVS